MYSWTNIWQHYGTVFWSWSWLPTLYGCKSHMVSRWIYHFITFCCTSKVRDWRDMGCFWRWFTSTSTHHLPFLLVFHIFLWYFIIIYIHVIAPEFLPFHCDTRTTNEHGPVESGVKHWVQLVRALVITCYNVVSSPIVTTSTLAPR